MKQEQVTAENLTDEQIRELHAAAVKATRDTEGKDFLDAVELAHLSAVALGIRRPAASQRRPGAKKEARRWVAAAINARAKGV